MIFLLNYYSYRTKSGKAEMVIDRIEPRRVVPFGIIGHKNGGK